jgi:thymidine phosphorylase
VSAQGGDARVVDAPDEVMRPARLRREVRAARAGYVQAVDALAVALAALHLGAGRTRAEDPVDHAVGFTRLVKTGTRVAVGDVLVLIHANDEAKIRREHLVNQHKPPVDIGAEFKLGAGENHAGRTRPLVAKCVKREAGGLTCA